MADQLGQAVLTLTVDDQQFNAGLNQAQRQAATAGQRIGQTFDGLANVFKGLAGVAGIVGIGALTQQIASTGQQAQKAEVQLNALAGGYGEAAQAGQAAARIQQVLGISTVEAASSFAQLYAALRGTGIGLQQLEVLFVGISNAARLSGAGTAEASAALLQLKQGLASGRLQGDELRSVLEQLPAFAQAIAKELGVSVGALRQLGSDGKITSDVIFNAAKSLASAATPGRTQIEQIGIAFENVQAQAAKAFGPALTVALGNVAAGLIAFQEYLKQNKAGLVAFGQSVLGIGKTLLPLITGILAVRAAYQAWAVAAKAAALASAAVTALSSPKGWANVLATVTATGIAAALLSKAFKGVADGVGKASAEAQNAKAAFTALLQGTTLQPVAAETSIGDKLLAQQQQQRVEAQLALQNVQQRIAYANELANAEAGVVRQTIQQRQEIEAGVQAAKDQVSLIGAQIDASRIKGGDNQEELQKLVNEQKVAASEIRLKLIEGATALRDAGKQLQKDLNLATLDLSGLQNDPKGLNQYLGPNAANERSQGALQLLLPQFRQAQNQFRALTGQASAPEFSGSAAAVVDSVRQFISQVNAESSASNRVSELQAALATNTKSLAEINNSLLAQIKGLTDKDWSVQVNVDASGNAQTFGDVLNGAI